MKLYAYSIDGQPIINYPAWQERFTGGNDRLIVSEEDAVEGYEDISSIENWDTYGPYVQDTVQRKFHIKRLVVAIAGEDFANWSLLTAAQKRLAAKYFVVPLSLRREVISDYEDEEFFEAILRDTKVDRANQIELIRRQVAQEQRLGTLPVIDANVLYEDVHLMVQYYIATANPKLVEWVTDEVNGFPTKSYFNEERQNILINILVNYKY